MPVTKENVDEVFSYHAPDTQQREALERVRTAARTLAKTILDEVPECADQQAALRSLRGCVFAANAAIMLKGQV
ncbi:MAG: hypothetical protein M3458_05310 [Acidobacteriota bacterium]|nr:hypothetical protein [Acidobacteriota bacterium]